MDKFFPLFPRQASTVADDIDALYFFLVALCGLVALLVVLALAYLAFKYRRGALHAYDPNKHAPLWLEYAWTIIPLFIFLGIFFWGAWVYFKVNRIPDDTLDVWVTGKQWMWKFQHESGQSEINSLHIPTGRPVKLIMASEDVIHSFFVPEFRVHRDVLPNRYTYAWIEATRTGQYHLFCSEYCGTEHSRMIGTVTVMEPEQFQIWLSGGAKGSPAEEGQKLFQSLGCNTCHLAEPTGRGPVLEGIFGTTVRLADGRTVVADENYIRESILNPQAKIVAGYQPIMPNFQAQVDEQGLINLITYVKSLTKPAAQAPGGGIIDERSLTEPPLVGEPVTGVAPQRGPAAQPEGGALRDAPAGPAPGGAPQGQTAPAPDSSTPNPGF